MPVSISASAMDRMLVSVTVPSPLNWFQLCQCMGGYGSSCAAGIGATAADVPCASRKSKVLMVVRTVKGSMAVRLCIAL